MTNMVPFSLLANQSPATVVQAISDFIQSSETIFADGAKVQLDQPFGLVFEGMSFALTCRVGSSRFENYQPIFLEVSQLAVRTEVSIEFGSNLEGAMRVPALAQGMIQFVALLAKSMDTFAVAANFANLAVEPGYFTESANDYIGGGAFPALAVVAFDRIDNHGGISSRGLELFAGQELHFAPSSISDADIMRRMVRLVHRIGTEGPISEDQVIDDIDTGSSLFVQPDQDSRNVHVSIRFGPDSDFV